MTVPNVPQPNLDAALGLYKAYLEDLGRLGGRHETLRQFYLSLISALFVFLALAGKDGVLAKVPDSVLRLVGAVGLAICLLWHLHMWRFADLFSSHISTLRELEKAPWFPLRPFTEEKSQHSGKAPRLTTVDRSLAVAFLLLFVWLLAVKTT